MKVFITKYALSSGIIETEAEDRGDGMISYKAVGSHYEQYFHGNEWHSTREQANALAQGMRLKKIESLNKQIEKIQKLKF